VYQIELTDTSEDGIHQCAEFLSLVYPRTKQFSPNYLSWQYCENPDGQCIGFNAFYQKELVAHYVTIPFKAEIFGKVSRGLLSLNTATHPSHQGKKLFTALAERTYDHGKNLGYDFIVGVANANSTPGFVRKLGFQLVGQLEAKIGLGDVVKKQVPVGIEYRGVWNPVRMSWRINNPSRSYYFAKHQEYIQILASTGKLGAMAMLGQVTPEIFDSQKAYKRGFPSLKLWIGLNCTVDWDKSMYVSIPNVLRPSPLNLIFKDLNESGLKLNPDQIIFDCMDFDAY